MSVDDSSFNSTPFIGNIQPYVCPKCNGYKEDLMYRQPCVTCNGQGVIFGSSWIPSNITVVASAGLQEKEICTITKEDLDELLDSIRDYKSWSAIVNKFPVLRNEDGTITVPERFVVRAESERSHNS